MRRNAQRGVAGAGELQEFRVRLTAKGRDTYAARSGEHDDLVIAVALAVWFGNLAQGHLSFTA